MTGVFAGLSDERLNGVWTLNIADVDIGETGFVSSAVLIFDATEEEILFVDGFDPKPYGSCTKAKYDFTGDGRTSFVLTRNVGFKKEWIIKANDGTNGGAVESFVLGSAQEVPVAGDYDGDGIYDAATRHPNSGKMFIRRSSRPSLVLIYNWGGPSGDTSNVGDFDGDGIDDFSVYYPAEGTMAIRPSSNGLWNGPIHGIPSFESGLAVGGVDFTGDRIADVAIRTFDGNSNWPLQFSIYDGFSSELVNTYPAGAHYFLVAGNHAGNYQHDVTVIYNDSGQMVWSTRDMQTGIFSPLKSRWGIGLPIIRLRVTMMAMAATTMPCFGLVTVSSFGRARCRQAPIGSVSMMATIRWPTVGPTSSSRGKGKITAQSCIALAAGGTRWSLPS